MRRLTRIGVVVALSLLAASCSSSGGTGPSSNGGPSGVLTIDNESGGNWTCDFNPFNLSDISFSLGTVYEPLMFVDTLANNKTTPWLATNSTWSNGNKTLTFTIRKGVKFTNGTPLSASDVVYTFNLLRQNKTLDINAVWSVLSSVTQHGADQVVMQFKAPAVSPTRTRSGPGPTRSVPRPARRRTSPTMPTPATGRRGSRRSPP